MELVEISLQKFKDYNDQYLLYNKYNNYHLGLYLSNLFTKKRTMINVGIGSFVSLKVCAHAYDTVHGFEPDRSFDIFVQQCHEHEYSNVHLHNMALSDQSTTRQFWSPEEDNENRLELVPGASLYYKPFYSHGKNKFYSRDIVTQTLDSVVEKYNIHDIDFIKIDAEQEDTNIVKGALSTIKENLPLIQIEEVTSELVELLKNINYCQVKWSSAIPKKLLGKGPLDIFFIHKDKLLC